jgi:hypothetical protein
MILPRASKTRRALHDLFLVTGDFGLLARVPGLVRQQHRRGPSGRGQCLQMFFPPAEMVLRLPWMLGMHSPIG